MLYSNQEGEIYMEKQENLYKKLFLSTFYLSAFTFGGGYVIISLMKKKFVDELKWISEDEMLNFTALAQSSPGPVAVNASILVGYRLAGLKGALVAIAGTIIPPLVTLSVISQFYIAFKTNLVVAAVLKGMQSGVAAVIIDVVLNLIMGLVKHKNVVAIITMVVAFIATYYFKINILIIIIVCALLGLFQSRGKTIEVEESL